jgi:hypothetical protein
MPATSKKPQPRGAMSDLLLSRMAEFDIPPWPGQALFERVVVFRVADAASASDTFIPDGRIVKATSTRDRDEIRSPRGVIVSAGLRALEILTDHGMEVGELVWLAPHLPYRFQVGMTKEGASIEFLFCNVGDIVLSEDLLDRIGRGVASNYLEVSGQKRKDPASNPDDI